MENLEEDLTCSVCYSLFSDPRVLPCSHTFCKACLDNLLQVSTNYSIWRPLRLPIKCPNCRGVVELPPSGVEALPTNVSLRAIVEKFQRDGEPRAPSCPEHHRQPLNMYCVQDRRLICGLCLTVGGHRGHAIDDLQAAFARERGAPSQLLAKLSEQRWAQVCELAEQLEQEKARCEALLRQDRLDVAQFFLSLDALLARKRQACLEALDEAAGEVAQAYDPLIHRAKELQEEQLDLVSLGPSVEEEDAPLVFLEKVHLFRERVEKLTTAPLPPVVSLSVTPRAAAFLQQHWAPLTLGSLEAAPVPKVCCCARCGGGGAEAGVESEAAGPDGEVRGSGPLRPAAMLLGLLLVVVGGALWGGPGGGASPGLSLLWRCSQVVHSLGSELAAAACALMGAGEQGWSSQLTAVSEKVTQHVAAMFKSLFP